MRAIIIQILFLMLLAGVLPAGELRARSSDIEVLEPSTQEVAPESMLRPVLDIAVMAEGIRDYAPYNTAVVFSITTGSVSCYTLFDPVPVRTFVIHRWFHRDRLSTQKRLALQPPRWATYSAIQLREVDKGPWRVEITDLEGNLLQELRFSVTD